MRVAVFSTKPYDRRFLERAAADEPLEFTWLEARLAEHTAALAAGHDAICAFVNDALDEATLRRLAKLGIRAIALRSAGFNNVDLAAAQRLGFAVARVPAYSPEAVAEHTVGLLLTLNRKFHRAYHRVRDGNFALDGLLGFDLHGKTVGIVGTGRIGLCVARILGGFGCHLLAFDPTPSAEAVAAGVRYVTLEELLEGSRVVTLHCPRTPKTHHLIGSAALARMQHGSFLINTSRGAPVEARAVIDGLKSGRLGGVALDVYEEEADLFFEDFSQRVIQDDVFARLLTFPNVVITGHQAFFTEEALSAIAKTTVDNLLGFASGKVPEANRVGSQHVQPRTS